MTKKKLAVPVWGTRFGVPAACVVWVVGAFLAVSQIVGLAVAGMVKLGIPLGSISRVVLVTLLTVVVYGVTVWLVIWVPKRVWRHATTKRELGAARLPSWMDIVLGPVSFLPYLLLSGGLLLVVKSLLPEANLAEKQELGFSTNIFGAELAFAFILFVIIAPLIEELLFRGYLYGKLRPRVGLIASMLLVSISFAVLHGQLNVGIDTFALSIVLCLLREFTGSIWAGVLLHATKNGLAFYLLFINPSLLSTIGG